MFKDIIKFIVFIEIVLVVVTGAVFLFYGFFSLYAYVHAAIIVAVLAVAAFILNPVLDKWMKL
jgi:heme A synthase